MTRLPPHKRNPDEEGETYQSIQENTLPETGGRFAGYGEPMNIGRTNKYPKLHTTSPLVTPQPDFGFFPDRDRVDEPTSMTFNADLRYLPGTPNWSPLEPSSVNSVPVSIQEQIERVEEGSFSHPNIKKVGAVWSAFAGKGMTREQIGSFASFEDALAAVRDAEAARKNSP